MFDEKHIARFWDSVDRGLADDCWPWLGPKNRRGYGVFSAGGERMIATRASLAIAGRQRPSEGHYALHRCDNPPCVNPAHLWWGTLKENALDASAKKRLANGRTHCKHGHEFTPENTSKTVNSRGHVGRGCRTCLNAQGNIRLRKRRAATAALAGLAKGK